MIIVPSMDLSIVIPILDDHQRFLQNCAEYSAFFQKFGIQFEVIVVCSDKISFAKINETAQTVAENSPHSLKVLLNSTNRSRSGAVTIGILNSRGKVIVISTADQMTPLASFFSALQAFMSDHELQLLSGNRLDPKRKHLGEKTQTKIQRVENHNRFYKEIFQIRFVDPTTPFLALRNNVQTQTLANKFKQINSWYYTPFWLYNLRDNSHKILEISIQENANSTSKFRPIKDNLMVYWTAILNR